MVKSVGKVADCQVELKLRVTDQMRSNRFPIHCGTIIRDTEVVHMNSYKNCVKALRPHINNIFRAWIEWIENLFLIVGQSWL